MAIYCSCPGGSTNGRHVLSCDRYDLTVRDKLAMAALTGLVSDVDYPAADDVARRAYAIANAMLIEREGWF